MSRRTYSMPTSDEEVSCEYVVERNGDIILAEIRDELGHVIDGSETFKMLRPSLVNPFLRDEKIVTLAEYFQEKLDHDACDIMQEYDDTFNDAAE